MDQKTAKKEKRENPRIPKEVAMTVTRLKFPLEKCMAATAVTKNINSQGLCFTVAKPFDTGTLVSIEINLQGWQHYLQNVFSIVDAATITKPLTAIAEVAWSKKLQADQGYAIGVCFKDIYEDDFLAFRTYLEKIADR